MNASNDGGGDVSSPASCSLRMKLATAMSELVGEFLRLSKDATTAAAARGGWYEVFGLLANGCCTV
jgi:hypothetical protein